MSKPGRLIALYLSASAAAIAAAPATAQVAGPAPAVDSEPQQGAQPAAADEPPVLADIIVTAEKRSTSLQRTPVAITALTGEALQNAQIRTLPDMTALIPNFQMGESQGYAQMTVRGIGIASFVPGTESAVALNLNDIYVSRPIAQLTGLYDVSSIEVLRGPQGTLYGRNATAGAVNITTTRPGDVWKGYARATVANYGQIRFEAAAGGPLVEDRLLIRVAGFRETRNGYGRNTITGNQIDNKDAYAFRATLVARPTDTITATVIGEYYDEDSRGASLHYFGAAGLTGLPGALGFPPVFLLQGGAVPSNPYDIANDEDPRFRLRTTALTGLLEWQSAPFSLKSITGYRDQNSLTKTDISGGPFSGGRFFGGEPAHQFSQELQGNWTTSAFNLTAGLFYFSEHDDYAPASIPVANLNLNLAFPNLPQRPVPGFTNFAETGGLTKTRAKAAFAQGTVNVTDKLSLTAGIRFSSERKQLFQRFAIDLYTPYTGSNPPPPAVAIPPRTFKSTTPKLGIQYQADRRTLFYLTYAKGFKSGGFDSGTDPSVVGLGFRPEKLTDIEGGIKTTFLDNRLRVNLSGFHYDYSDLQVQQVLGTSQIVTANAGTARVYGVEAELSALVTSAFSIDANAAWLHARYRDYTGLDNALPLTPTIDFAGKRLNNAPDFRAHVAATYTWPLAAGRLAARAEGDYSSKFFFSPANLPLVGQSAFAKANAFLTYTADAGWHATAFVRNVTNRVTRTSGYAGSPLFGSAVNGSYAPPRTFGVELGYSF